MNNSLFLIIGIGHNKEKALGSGLVVHSVGSLLISVMQLAGWPGR